MKLLNGIVNCRSKALGQVLLLCLAACAVVLCAYLAFVLNRILETICLVCFATYATNLLTFWSLAIMYYKD